MFKAAPKKTKKRKYVDLTGNEQKDIHTLGREVKEIQRELRFEKASTEVKYSFLQFDAAYMGYDNPVIACLTEIPVGDDRSSRVGNKIRLTTIRMSLQFVYDTNILQPVENYRLIVVQSRGSISSDEVVTEGITPFFVNGGGNSNCYWRAIDQQAWYVLYDSGPKSMAGAPNNTSGTLTFYSIGSVPQHSQLSPITKVIQYDGSAGTARHTSAIYLVAVSDVLESAANISINGFTQTRFVDS